MRKKKKYKKTAADYLDSDGKAVVIKKPFSYFRLHCCDCDLRHDVFVEDCGKVIKVGLSADRSFKKVYRQAQRLKKQVKKLKKK